MLKQNEHIFSYTNLDKWQKAGYNGKNVKIAILESIGSDHQKTVEEVIKECSNPNDIYLMNNNVIDMKKCIDLGIKLINISQATTFYPNDLKKCYNAGITILFSAGNNYGNGLGEGAKLDFVLSVGTVEEAFGSIRVAPYSSGGKELDTVCFIPYIQGSDYAFQPSGTSFSAPMALSLLRCWFQWHYENYNRYPMPQESYEFVKLNSKDILEKGHDYESGYGIFCLPGKIPIRENKEMKMEFTIGSKDYYINGNKKTLLTPPILNSGTTLVPLRVISENFGCKISWDEKTKKIIITA